jgi:hypothetical protein
MACTWYDWAKTENLARVVGITDFRNSTLLFLSSSSISSVNPQSPLITGTRNLLLNKFHRSAISDNINDNQNVSM